MKNISMEANTRGLPLNGSETPRKEKETERCRGRDLEIERDTGLDVEKERLSQSG